MNQLQMINRMLWGGGLDPDAKAFLDATSITDGTITTAINQFVIDLKAYNIWTKLKALYPFVGGTATTHKFNLKDPRDLDVAFRMAFFGVLTHDANGVKPNGGYANTFLNTRTHIQQYKACTGIYSRDITSSGTTFMYGSGSNGTFLTHVNGNSFFWNIYPDPSITYTGATLKLMIMRRESSTLLQGYRDGVSIGIQTGTSSTANPDAYMFYGALNNGGASGHDSTPSSLFFIGEDFTHQNAIDMNTAVNRLQTTLGRAV